MHKTARRNKILNVTISLLKDQGLQGAKMDQIAKLAEVSKKTIYQYFGSKPTLVAMAITNEIEQLLNDLRIIAQIDELSPMDRLESSLLLISRRAFEANHMNQHLLSHPEIRKLFDEQMQYMIRFLLDTYFQDSQMENEIILKGWVYMLLKCCTEPIGISELNFRESVIPFYLNGWAGHSLLST